MAVVVCLSVCLSQAGIASKRMGKSSAGFGVGFIPHILYTVSWCRVTPKIRVLPSGTLVSNSEYFATTSRSCCQQNSSMVELVDHTCDGRSVVAVYYASVGRNYHTQLLNFCLATSTAALCLGTKVRRYNWQCLGWPFPMQKY